MVSIDKFTHIINFSGTYIDAKFGKHVPMKAASTGGNQDCLEFPKCCQMTPTRTSFKRLCTLGANTGKNLIWSSDSVSTFICGREQIYLRPYSLTDASCFARSSADFPCANLKISGMYKHPPRVCASSVTQAYYTSYLSCVS